MDNRYSINNLIQTMDNRYSINYVIYFMDFVLAKIKFIYTCS